MQRHWRQRVKKERSDFVQRVEHETVTPHDNGATQRTHGEDVVDLREDKDTAIG